MTGASRNDRDRLVLLPQERRDAVVELIRGARERLILSLFRCNDFGILEELTAASARGVHIEVLITQRAKGGRRRRRRLGLQFEAMGAAVWHYDDPLVKYHAKYIVSDAAPALVGSFNLTRKCFRKTCDFAVVSHDPAVVRGLNALFAADCRRQALPATLSPRLVVAPEDARGRLAALIGGASSHIRLIDPKVDDPAFVELLTQKSRDGLRVDVVTGKRAGGMKAHGKLLVVDARVALISSMSLSPASLDSRREVAIEISEAAEVQRLIDFFHRVAGPDPLPLPTLSQGEDAVL